MYYLKYKDINGKQVKEYDTRQEAVYYSKQHKKSKVTTFYWIYDIDAGLMADTYKIEAENPKQALRQFLYQRGIKGSISRDMRGGRFVVKSQDRTLGYDFIPA